MRAVARIGLLLMLATVPHVVVAAEVDLRYEQGRVSASLDTVPVPEVLAALRRATGLEVVVPPAATAKTVSLTADTMPLETFLRRLLDALDLGGYLMVYEPEGKAGRVRVVERGSGPEPAPAPPGRGEAAETAESPASGPIYIPPAQPPVYVPPREPPVYIPPSQPPVYVPPAAPTQ